MNRNRDDHTATSTELCKQCEWIEVTTLGDTTPDYILGRPCREHMTTGELDTMAERVAQQQARQEVEQIERYGAVPIVSSHKASYD